MKPKQVMLTTLFQQASQKLLGQQLITVGRLLWMTFNKVEMDLFTLLSFGFPVLSWSLNSYYNNDITKTCIIMSYLFMLISWSFQISQLEKTCIQFRSNKPQPYINTYKVKGRKQKPKLYKGKKIHVQRFPQYKRRTRMAQTKREKNTKDPFDGFGSLPEPQKKPWFYR
jgi:hypothetical protein